MSSSGTWRRVVLVETDVSEERLPLTSFFACEYLYPEDEDDTFVRNVTSYKIHKATQLRRRHSS
jgi:hypothetical protein